MLTCFNFIILDYNLNTYVLLETLSMFQRDSSIFDILIYIIYNAKYHNKCYGFLILKQLLEFIRLTVNWTMFQSVHIIFHFCLQGVIIEALGYFLVLENFLDTFHYLQHCILLLLSWVNISQCIAIITVFNDNYHSSCCHEYTKQFHFRLLLQNPSLSNISFHSSQSLQTSFVMRKSNQHYLSSIMIAVPSTVMLVLYKFSSRYQYDGEKCENGG